MPIDAELDVIIGLTLGYGLTNQINAAKKLLQGEHPYIQFLLLNTFVEGLIRHGEIQTASNVLSYQHLTRLLMKNSSDN